MMSSVKTDAAAIVGAQPFAFTFASMSVSPSTRTVSLIRSRQTSLVTSPTPDGLSSSPTLRGFAMCSAICALYIAGSAAVPAAAVVTSKPSKFQFDF